MDHSHRRTFAAVRRRLRLEPAPKVGQRTHSDSLRAFPGPGPLARPESGEDPHRLSPRFYRDIGRSGFDRRRRAASCESVTAIAVVQREVAEPRDRWLKSFRCPATSQSSAGRTRTYNQWINSPGPTVRPVQVGVVCCGLVGGSRSEVLSGGVRSGDVRLHKWLHRMLQSGVSRRSTK
jgi:hypothetical protein